jgi:hypothetical protein
VLQPHGEWNQSAIGRVVTPASARIVSVADIDQPTMRRLKASSTTAR